MHTTVTVSCETSQEKTGPSLVHSTGVQNYRVQPEIIRLLQESCTNDNLCDHEKGVECKHDVAHLIDVFKRAGFTVTSQSTAGSRKLWMLTKDGEGGGAKPNPHGGDHKPHVDPKPKVHGNDEEEGGEEGGEEEGEGEGEGEGEEEEQ